MEARVYVAANANELAKHGQPDAERGGRRDEDREREEERRNVDTRPASGRHRRPKPVDLCVGGEEW